MSSKPLFLLLTLPGWLLAGVISYYPEDLPPEIDIGSAPGVVYTFTNPGPYNGWTVSNVLMRIQQPSAHHSGRPTQLFPRRSHSA